MKKKLASIISISLLVIVITTLAVVLTACGDNNKEEEKPFGITAADPLPVITPYQDFDVSTAIVVEDGVAYEYEGFYINSRGQEKTIEFNDSIVNIPQNDVVAEITVTAVKGAETAEKLIKLNVCGTPDVIDNGISELWCENAIGKNLNFDPQYIMDGDSSIKVTFSGYYTAYGTQYANLNGHLSTKEGGIYDRPYYDIYEEENQDEAWKDAVMTFWIYYANPPKNSTANLDIGYFFAYLRNGEEQRVCFEFGDSPITSCTAGQWTQIAIRFKDFGKQSDLYLNVQDYYSPYAYDINKNCDSVNFKCRVIDQDSIDKGVKYNYTFYMDGLNIMTYADFTATYPEYEFGIDQGDTLSGNFQIPEWQTAGKGISFEYKLIDPDTATQDSLCIVAHVYDGQGHSDWARLTDYITLDFTNNTATAGQIIDLGNGRFRYELMLDDAPVNSAPGETPAGDETADIIYFNSYETHFLMSNLEVIDGYTE